MSPSGSCQAETKWQLGDEFIQLLKLNDFYGLSGRVKFNPYTGYRKSFSFRIVDVARDGLSIVITYFFYYFFRNQFYTNLNN